MKKIIWEFELKNNKEAEKLFELLDKIDIKNLITHKIQNNNKVTVEIVR